MLRTEINEEHGYNPQYWHGEENHHKEALVEAESLWSKDRDNIELLMRWVSCMHDLAKLYELKPDYKKTFYHLITPHNWIVNKLHDKTLSEDEITITLNALKITFLPLYRYSLKRPCCDACRKNLEDQHAWFKHTEKRLH
jgi:hypothetical protein